MASGDHRQTSVLSMQSLSAQDTDCSVWKPSHKFQTLMGQLVHNRGFVGNSLVVQWLGLHDFISKDPGLDSGKGSVILKAA